MVLGGFLVCSMFLAFNPSAVKAQSSQIYWGAWVSDASDGHIGSYSAVTTFENQVGKDVSIWDWIQLWNRPDDSNNIAEFDTAQMTECRDAGIIPMISWSPESASSNSSDTPAFNSLQDILDGTFDSYLTAWGDAAKAWNHPFFVRLMWEFTGVWSGSCYPGGSGNTPALFVQAWQYIVNKVRATGETDISWVWCPAAVGDSESTLQSVYPGNNYVDWTATDIYAGLNEVSISQDTQQQTEINSIQAVAPGKPMMFAELGDNFASCATWWNNVLTNELPNEYPFVKAFCLWQQPTAGLDVTSPSGMLATFQKGISSSYYSSNVYSSLNNSPIPVLGSSVTSTPTPIQPPSNVVVSNVKLGQSFVESGFVLPINVTVQNSGSVSEQANIELFANSTSIFNGTISIANLASGTLVCQVNTQNLPIGNYSISASVTPLDEPTATPSTMSGGTVGVTYVGDLTCDFKVDGTDFFMFMNDYVAYWTTGFVNPAADFGHDGKIDFSDIQLFINAYINYYGEQTT